MDPWCTSCRDHWETPVEIIMNSPAPTEFNHNEGVERDMELTNIGESGHDQDSGRSASGPSSLKILKGSTKVIVDSSGSDGGGIGGGGDGEGGSVGAEIEIPSVNGDSTSIHGDHHQPNDIKPSLLHEYLKLLNCFGVGAYDVVPSSKRVGKMQIARQITFAAISFLSLFQALNEIKDRTYGDARLDHVFGHVSIAYFVSNLVVLMLYFQVIAFKHSKLDELLQSFSNVSARYNSYPKLLSALPFILGTVSVMDGLATAMFDGMDGLEITNWSPSSIILLKSYRLRRAVLLRSNSSLQNDTLDDYFQKQTEALTMSNIAIGGFSMSAEFSYWLQQTVCTHLFLILSLSLYMTSSQLKFCIPEKGLVFISSNSRISGHEENAIWKTYQEILLLSNTIESTFGLLLRGIHMCILLSFGHFFWITVYAKDPTITYWLLPLRLIFALVSYYFAIKSARKHDSFRQWMAQNYAERHAIVVLHGRTMDKFLVMEDLSYYRIGIGSNLFYINDEFVLKCRRIILCIHFRSSYQSKLNWTYTFLISSLNLYLSVFIMKVESCIIFVIAVLLLLVAWAATDAGTSTKHRKKGNGDSG